MPSIKCMKVFLLMCSTLFLLSATCLLCLYGVLTFSPHRHFHCCEPAGLTFAQLSAVVLPLPVLLALSGLFGWASVRTGLLSLTLLHLVALLLLAGYALLLGAGSYTSQAQALQVLARNFQLVRDCRSDWVVDRLQEELACSGWNQSTAHRSACQTGKLNASVEAAPTVGSCRERVVAFTLLVASWLLATGLSVAVLALISLSCQCSYQWKISDPAWQRRAGGRAGRRPRRLLASSSSANSNRSVERSTTTSGFTAGRASTLPARSPLSPSSSSAANAARRGGARGEKAEAPMALLQPLYDDGLV